MNQRRDPHERHIRLVRGLNITGGLEARDHGLELGSWLSWFPLPSFRPLDELLAHPGKLFEGLLALMSEEVPALPELLPRHLLGVHSPVGSRAQDTRRRGKQTPNNQARVS